MRFRDLAVLVDHVRDAAGVLILRRVGGPVGEADLVIGVAEEGEGVVVLLCEVGVLFDRVEADADDAGVLLFVLFVEVPEPGTFSRSTACVGLRIEPEDHLLPAEVAQLHRVAVVVQDLEIRSRITHLQHLRTPHQILCYVTQSAGQRHRSDSLSWMDSFTTETQRTQREAQRKFSKKFSVSSVSLW
jgi:hypothetical protein